MSALKRHGTRAVIDRLRAMSWLVLVPLLWSSCATMELTDRERLHVYALRASHRLNDLRGALPQLDQGQTRALEDAAARLAAGEPVLETGHGVLLTLRRQLVDSVEGVPTEEAQVPLRQAFAIQFVIAVTDQLRGVSAVGATSPVPARGEEDPGLLGRLR